MVSASVWPYANGKKETSEGKLVPLHGEELNQLEKIAIEVSKMTIFNGVGHYEYIVAGKVGMCRLGLVRAEVKYREKIEEVTFLVKKSRSGKSIHYRPV